MAKYKLDGVLFETKEAKKQWILKGILLSVEYIGKESNLSITEKGLRKLAINDLKKLIKCSILKK